MENLAYALVQWLHNFGAAAVLGAAVAARWPTAQAPDAQRRLAWLVLFAWLAQFASGALFGAVSLGYYGRLPDLSPVARGALVVKVGCAGAAVVLVATWLRRRHRWTEAALARAWHALAVLAALALSAAAFLRWFA